MRHTKSCASYYLFNKVDLRLRSLDLGEIPKDFGEALREVRRGWWWAWIRSPITVLYMGYRLCGQKSYRIVIEIWYNSVFFLMPNFLHEIYIDIFHFSIFVSINLSLIYLFIYLSMCRYLLMNPSYHRFLILVLRVPTRISGAPQTSNLTR